LDNAVEARADAVQSQAAARQRAWQGGSTRRRVLAGVGKVGVAALGAQLVTTRVAFAAPAARASAAEDGRTLVVLFLRGGMDGLSAVVPAFDPDYYRARPKVGVPQSLLLPADRGFGLHPALAPLQPYWSAGQLAAVHAVASPDASRSHFQAQDCLERGGNGVLTGWLDRLLSALGPGTTFRAVAEGSSAPRSLAGTSGPVVLSGLQNFTLSGASAVRDRTMTALQALYTGVDHPLAAQTKAALGALDAGKSLLAATPASTVAYPKGELADALKDIARMIRGGAGLRVASVDVGGWDMHTAMGKADSGQLRTHLGDLAAALAAFAADLGPALDNVNLVTMSEFGRRVTENGSGGADHGHGGLMMLLGGGLNGGKVHGTWPGLAPAALDHGDLAGANDHRDVLAEVVCRRFGVGNVSPIFPGYAPRTLGVCR
jgi:uncharacterized protein (DUF1501 family)